MYRYIVPIFDDNSIVFKCKKSTNVLHASIREAFLLTLIRKRRRFRNVEQLIDTVRCGIANLPCFESDKSARIEGLPRRG